MESVINVENRISRKLRLGSMLTDHVVMGLFIVPPMIVISVIFKSEYPFASSPFTSVLYYLMMLIYFNKDFFRARSVAKRMTGLQIIDRKTNQPANELKCFLRNITIPLWPLEVLVSLISPNRRLGDWIANTRVEKADREDAALILEDIKKIKLTQLTLLTFVIGAIYMGMLWYVLNYFTTYK